jgi:enamine deaminase RidA (YjgF/YER057c/UK114 family)
MATRRTIIPAGMENMIEKLRYAPGILIGDTLYASGQVGRDENLTVIEDPEAQFEQCFRNVGKILDAADFAFDDIVELETWFTHFPEDLAAFRGVKNRWITGPDYPTWTALGVSALSMPALRLELRFKAIRADRG